LKQIKGHILAFEHTQKLHNGRKRRGEVVYTETGMVWGVARPNPPTQFPSLATYLTYRYLVY